MVLKRELKCSYPALHYQLYLVAIISLQAGSPIYRSSGEITLSSLVIEYPLNNGATICLKNR